MCTFRTVHTDFYAKSAVSSSRIEHVLLYLVISANPLPLRYYLCLKASRKGHLLNTQISLVPGVPQILFTPQTIAIDQGTNSKVVPTSYDRLGHPYCRWSHSPQIYSICFSPNLSLQADGYHHTHLDIQRRPILWGARPSWLDLSNKGYGPTSPIMKRCLYW